MVDYLESNPLVFFAIFIVVSLYVLISFYIGGRKAGDRFDKLSDHKVIFREKGASGHSKRSIITRFGGANRALDVIVTDRELWIKGIWPFFSHIGMKYDLTHRIPLTNIIDAKAYTRKVILRFTNESGEESHIELNLRDPEGFLCAIRV